MDSNINCSHNDRGPWCKNIRVKRSLWGLGARMCSVFQGKPCPFQQKLVKPSGIRPGCAR